MADKRAVPEKPMDGKVIARTPFGDLLNEMAMRADIDAQDSSINETTLNKVLTAETPEEFWDADEKSVVNAQDMIGKEMLVRTFHVRRGKADDPSKPMENVYRDSSGVGLYLDVDCVLLENGEEIVFNTSAKFLVAKFIQAERLGMFPLECVIQGIDLGGGQTVLKLRPVPKRAVQSTAF